MNQTLLRLNSCVAGQDNSVMIDEITDNQGEAK